MQRSSSSQRRDPLSPMACLNATMQPHNHSLMQKKHPVVHNDNKRGFSSSQEAMQKSSTDKNQKFSSPQRTKCNIKTKCLSFFLSQEHSNNKIRNQFAPLPGHQAAMHAFLFNAENPSINNNKKHFYPSLAAPPTIHALPINKTRGAPMHQCMEFPIKQGVHAMQQCMHLP